MIKIGLSGWGDHDDLYPPRTPARDKLAWYARYFSLVEVDSAFYAVLGTEVYRRWLAETPADMTFILKAYQGMTGHSRGKTPYGGPGEMFQAYLDSIQPVVEAGRLTAVLFQFPPWFDCSPEHVRQLRAVCKWMGRLPLALEFRHQSWFAKETRERTLAFMREEGWIHVVCDEPQSGQGSVPTVLEPTDSDLTLVRLHGRNAAGWSQSGSPHWRELRNLYRYSREELLEWRDMLSELSGKGTREIGMIFNNNSGGDAAGNALEMMEILGLRPRALPPRQLDLFDV
ncbi:DUF72 domain-containing protein [Paenibacillus macerans]|uniref:DUF72 domain-containing protein n=1 Tax=Paenibacillus macerans TaxID=44252 RepID=UPI00242DBFBA|nr:DUF72 domain-containing protein [Paenibacillus macerans]MBS5912409.1 DUF72 domain-containing protein [Paenibacillus macerans]MED4954824.1 DUF72 domain-containing protein [Paenibacillus macerans]